MVVIFDCNVLLSAFISKRSKPRLCWEKIKNEDTVIASHETFAEFSRVFLSTKFDKYLTLEARLEVQTFIKIIPVRHTVTVCRDVKDNMYLELGLSGQAAFIITGDPDLLVLNPFENISIVTPKEFLDFR